MTFSLFVFICTFTCSHVAHKFGMPKIQMLRWLCDSSVTSSLLFWFHFSFCLRRNEIAVAHEICIYTSQFKHVLRSNVLCVPQCHGAYTNYACIESTNISISTTRQDIWIIYAFSTIRTAKELICDVLCAMRVCVWHRSLVFQFKYTFCWRKKSELDLKRLSSRLAFP